jgi:hypothetical protein
MSADYALKAVVNAIRCNPDHALLRMQYGDKIEGYTMLGEFRQDDKQYEQRRPSRYPFHFRLTRQGQF